MFADEASITVKEAEDPVSLHHVIPMSSPDRPLRSPRSPRISFPILLWSPTNIANPDGETSIGSHLVRFHKWPTFEVVVSGVSVP